MKRRKTAPHRGPGGRGGGGLGVTIDFAISGSRRPPSSFVSSFLAFVSSPSFTYLPVRYLQFLFVLFLIVGIDFGF